MRYFRCVGGIATEYATAKLTGTCFSYGLGDAIGDALCVGRLFKFAKLAKRAPCLGNSFTGDTLVYTETGLRPISDIKVGERVRSYTEWNGQEQFEAVEEVISNTKEYLLVTLTLESNETLVATNQHPFYILGKGWVEAEDLKHGDPLYLSDKRTLHIRDINTETRTETVYNLSVANANTFFIGHDKVLVHNAKRCPYANPKNRPCYAPGQVQAVWNAAVSKRPDGRVFDPNTKKELFWDGGSRVGQWDMGHKPGKDYASLHDKYIAGDISKQEFLDEYRNPNNYHPEDPSSNRSRKHDTPNRICK
ncbi:GH-E family nuclease [Shewanella sp. JL219SE-S6]